SSISAWFQVASSPDGSSSSARRRSAAGGRTRPSRRSITRRVLTSTAATGSPNANDATAAAVYGPTPGSSRRPSASRGQPVAAPPRTKRGSPPRSPSGRGVRERGLEIAAQVLDLVAQLGRVLEAQVLGGREHLLLELDDRALQLVSAHLGLTRALAPPAARDL